MSPAAGSVAPNMAAAVEAYRSTRETMASICERFSVSRRGLCIHIERLNINRDPLGYHSGGGQWEGKIGPDHPRWKGGSCVDHYGYVMTTDRTYPHVRSEVTAQVQEHIIVMERRLGRRLAPNECVHHKDENRQNNADDNLELMTKGEHSRLHRYLEAERRAIAHAQSMIRAFFGPGDAA